MSKSWENIEFDKLFSFVIGGDWGKDLNESDLNFIETYCIRGSEIRDWSKDKGRTAVLRKISRSSLEKRALQEGDILVEISGGGPDQPVGRTVLIDKETLEFEPDVPKVCTNFLRMVRLVDSVDKAFVNYYLTYFYQSGEVVNYQGGSNNLRNLKFKEYSKIEVPLAPLLEQKRIVAKLDKLFAHLDQLKARLENVPTLLKQFRQAVLTQAVTGKLISSEDEFEELLIDDLVNFIGSGITPKGGKENYLKEGIPFIRSMNVYPDGLYLENLAYITPEMHNDMSRSKVKDKDVLLNITGASIGRATYVPSGFGEANVNQHVCILRANDRILPEFLSLYLNSDSGQSYIMGTQTGMTRQGLNYSQIRAMPISVPRILDQKEIVRRVELLFAMADKIEASYTTLKEKIEQLPQAILSKAFRGELVGKGIKTLENADQ